MALMASTHCKTIIQMFYEKSLPGFHLMPQWLLSSIAMTTMPIDNCALTSYPLRPRTTAITNSSLQNMLLMIILTKPSTKSTS